MSLTLETVAQYNASRRETLIHLVLSAAEAERTWKPSPDRWSLQEHLEHIALFAREMAPVFENGVAEARAKGYVSTPEAPRNLDPLPVLLQKGGVDRPFAAPPVLVPQGRSLLETLTLLHASQVRILKCVGDFPLLDTDKVTWYHAVLEVELNLGQLWAFQGGHDQRHIKHMRTILAQIRQGQG